MSEGYDRYGQAILTAKIECESYHPTQNCDHKRNIRLSVEGADWQTLSVATCLKRLTARPQSCKDNSGDLTVPLTWAMITQCARLMKEDGHGWRPSPPLNQWIADEFLRRHDETGWKTADGLKFDTSKLGWTPMPHQYAGMYVGALNKRFFFCDDMRTGKTRTALLTLAELEARGEDPWPAFVVCPASVVDPWLEELEKAFPDWPATEYRGTKRKRLSTRFKIYVMSWNTFTRDMKHEPQDFSALENFLIPKTLVLDEAHALCNVTTKQSTAAKRLARVAKFAFLMSGTPITRDVGGFWTALNVLDIRSFPDPDRYKDMYTDRYKTDYSEEIDGLNPQTREEFYLLMKGSYRRIAKRDVNASLPPVSYSTRVVQIPPAYRTAYDEMEHDMIAHIPDTDEPLEVMSTLAQLQRLTQLAATACDVEIEMVLETREDHPMYGEEVPRYKVTMREPSWKIDELMNIMAENEGTGNPLLVFSPHTQLVNLAGIRAQKAGYKVGYITGQQNHKQKNKFRLAYQDGELDLMCLNLTAGGVGLTLNRGDTIVMLERSFAYWQNAQGESRADDIVNGKQIHVIDIVAANTVESRVRQAVKDKARQLSELVRDPRIVTEILGGQPIHVK